MKKELLCVLGVMLKDELRKTKVWSVCLYLAASYYILGDKIASLVLGEKEKKETEEKESSSSSLAKQSEIWKRSVVSIPLEGMWHTSIPSLNNVLDVILMKFAGSILGANTKRKKISETKHS